MDLHADDDVPIAGAAFNRFGGTLAHAGEEALSERELEVLRLVASGKANKVIAAQLFIGEETVKRHVSNILAKLHANDRTHAVTIGLKRGIIEL